MLYIIRGHVVYASRGSWDRHCKVQLTVLQVKLNLLFERKGGRIMWDGRID